MMGGHSVQPSSFPGTMLPPPGTPGGIARRNEFIALLQEITGDLRLLWLPSISDTATTTGACKNASVFTYDATIAARISVLESGVLVSFNGSSQYATVPDSAEFSFGDGVSDEAFTLFSVVNQTATATIKNVLTKYDVTTGLTKREWTYNFEAAEKVGLYLFDESVGARIGRVADAALATATNLFTAATYDGSRSSAGIRLYSAAAVVASTASDSGTYVAMENTASLVRLGIIQAAAAPGEYFNGSMGMVGLSGGALTPDRLWQMKVAINAFYGSSL